MLFFFFFFCQVSYIKIITPYFYGVFYCLRFYFIDYTNVLLSQVLLLCVYGYFVAQFKQCFNFVSSTIQAVLDFCLKQNV